MKITFKIHFLFFMSAFICIMTGLFKDFIIISSIIMFHELGHITLAFIFKWPISKIIIFPFGGLTVFNQKINSSLKEEFLIALAGPIFQIIFFYLINQNNTMFINYHYLILLFNLLPIFPLDGAKIINILCNKIFPFKQSYILTIITSIITIFAATFLLLNKEFNLIMFFSFSLLMIKLWDYYQNIDLTFNKFLFERYLYKIKYQKRKQINDLKINLMFKEKTHEFLKDNNIIKEEEILAKMFDTKSDL